MASQALPGVFIDLADLVLAGGLTDEAFQHLVKAVAPTVSVEVGKIHPDQLELLRDQVCGGKVVQRWNKQSLGQVAPGAEDDHGTWSGWMG